MDRKARIERIKQAAVIVHDTGLYKGVAGDQVAEVRGVASSQQGVGTEDVQFLLSEIERLELINGQLVQHNQELIAEMENVRADFGGDHR